MTNAFKYYKNNLVSKSAFKFICHKQSEGATRKWSIPDVEKDIGIKNVGNKGFPNTINTASGKHSFPTHHEGVGKYSSGKGTKTKRGKERRSREPLSFPSPFRRCFIVVHRRCPSPPSATLAMNRFVEHQMLTTFKEFRTDCHRHFKKYSDLEEVCANPPNALVGRDEDWHFLCDHYISCAFKEQSRTNKAARQKQPYNHSSGSKSFLQRQYELAERKGEPINRVELFRETHVRAGTFVSQVAEDAHNQMLELQSQPTPEGSQTLSKDKICDQVLHRRLGYSKGLGWGPKSKARRTASASSSSTSCSQSIEKEIELQAKFHEALEQIEVQDRNHQALASQVESMKKMIEELTRAQQGPPHDP
ncbi:CACTA en-spm transposon protein [Cucumis melo var. makuwa]|uniref:CACTA en-spm transposon protein n=2 Tax=Cucumis melo TaxID=3656 RepID=A0A5A7VGM2_CUCMM|nr:CACTA en-spm transposon protein [Cucumis melo var. makuwa]